MPADPERRLCAQCDHGRVGSIGASTDDESWAADFVRGLSRDLRVEQRRGAWVADKVEVRDASLVTVLTEVATGRRYGRTIELATLRQQFSPDTPGIVSAGWFFTFFPPTGWDDAHVHDDVCWFAGQHP